MRHRVTAGLSALALLGSAILVGASTAAGAAPQTPAAVSTVRPRPPGTALPLPSIVEQAVTKAVHPEASPLFFTNVGRMRSLTNDVVHVDDSGSIELSFWATRAVGAAQVKSLRALGATHVQSVHLAAKLGLANVGLVQAFVPAAKVTKAASLSWVSAVTAPDYGHVDVGSVTSEGVAFHHADQAQAAGITGSGVTVGVISDGDTTRATSQGTNDLPPDCSGATPFPQSCLNTISAGSGDEGTAMMEIVHDMAPDARLAFNGTGGSVATHVTAMNNLVGAGVNVIAEDIPFDAEPAFQKGLAAQTAENIAAAGVSVHSSAGNLGNAHAARVTATGTGTTPDNTANTSFTGCGATLNNVVAIAPGGDTTFDVSVPASGMSATLQWSEPRSIFPSTGQGGFTDLNLYLMNSTLTTCVAVSNAVQANGVGDTIEQISASPGAGNYKLVVNVAGTSSAVSAPTLDLRWRGAGAIDTTTRAGSLNPDSNYTGLATSAAAIDAVTAGIESFSGGGPVQLGSTTICPGNAAGPCTGTSGGGVSSSQGPTWAAADGVQVTGVGGFGSPFFGTSAAAPHAGACDALVRQGRPTITVADVIQRLKSTAVDQAPVGVDNITGAGLLDCFNATKDATTTTLTSSPNPSDFGNTVTFTATVTPAAGTAPLTGTVAFVIDGTTVATIPLDGMNPGHAVLATAGLQPGNHQVVAKYSGDDHYLPSTSSPLTQTVTCVNNLTGNQGSLTLGAGSWCLNRVNSTGNLTITNAAAVSIINSSVATGISATGAKALQLCGSRIVNGPLTAAGSTGFVLIGDPSDDHCAGNSINGLVNLQTSAGGVEIGSSSMKGLTVANTSGTGAYPEDDRAEIEHNQITGNLACTGNVPPPTNGGQPNTVTGTRTGQCGPGF